jgi:hypothetical protein
VNKSDPNEIVDDFVAATRASIADWKTIDSVLSGEGVRLRRRAAADSFMALAVSWEGFLSRWLIAAINRDASQAVLTLETRITSHATAQLRIPGRHLSASLITRSHMTVAEGRRLLDPDDYNIVIRSRADLKDSASTWLADPYRAAAVGVSEYQFRPALLTRLIRNVLAHHSNAAVTAANDQAAKGSTSASLRWTGTAALTLMAGAATSFQQRRPCPA